MIETLIGFAVLFGVFVVLPLMALKLLFHLVIGLVLLPFKLLGLLFHVAFKVVGGVFKLLGGLLAVAVGGAGVVLALGLGLLFILALPLLPLLLLGGFVWALYKAFAPGAAVVSA